MYFTIEKLHSSCRIIHNKILFSETLKCSLKKKFIIKSWNLSIIPACTYILLILSEQRTQRNISMQTLKTQIISKNNGSTIGTFVICHQVLL